MSWEVIMLVGEEPLYHHCYGVEAYQGTQRRVFRVIVLHFCSNWEQEILKGRRTQLVEEGYRRVLQSMHLAAVVVGAEVVLVLGSVRAENPHLLRWEVLQGCFGSRHYLNQIQPSWNNRSCKMTSLLPGDFHRLLLAAHSDY